MKEVNYWNEFLNTGKVNDYLLHRGINITKEQTEKQTEEGANPDAGINQCYRDDIEGGAFRGI